ncbi:hypothetical protein Tco_1306375, partial [Tanacetum coccineum]
VDPITPAGTVMGPDGACWADNEVWEATGWAGMGNG